MKTVLEKMKDVLDELRAMAPSRARNNAIARLEESSFWASAAIVGVESPIEHVAATEKKATTRRRCMPGTKAS